MYLLDIDTIAEIRKIGTDRVNKGVEDWARQSSRNLMFISSVTLLELERGVLSLERQDAEQGSVYRRWLDDVVKPQFTGRVLAFDAETALLCAQMPVPDKKGLADGLMAATAIHHNLIVVTRNEKDFAHTGAKVFNPFTDDGYMSCQSCKHTSICVLSH